MQVHRKITLRCYLCIYKIVNFSVRDMLVCMWAFYVMVILLHFSVCLMTFCILLYDKQHYHSKGGQLMFFFEINKYIYAVWAHSFFNVTKYSFFKQMLFF